MEKLFFFQAKVSRTDSGVVIEILQRQIKTNYLDGYKILIDYDGKILQVCNIPEQHHGFMHGLLLGILTMLPSSVAYVHVWPQANEVHKESFRRDMVSCVGNIGLCY